MFDRVLFVRSFTPVYEDLVCLRFRKGRKEGRRITVGNTEVTTVLVSDVGTGVRSPDLIPKHWIISEYSDRGFGCGKVLRTKFFFFFRITLQLDPFSFD